jgi:hypothetical protein
MQCVLKKQKTVTSTLIFDLEKIRHLSLIMVIKIMKLQDPEDYSLVCILQQGWDRQIDDDVHNIFRLSNKPQGRSVHMLIYTLNPSLLDLLPTLGTTISSSCCDNIHIKI